MTNSYYVSIIIKFDLMNQIKIVNEIPNSTADAITIMATLKYSSRGTNGQGVIAVIHQYIYKTKNTASLNFPYKVYPLLT